MTTRPELGAWEARAVSDAAEQRLVDRSIDEAARVVGGERAEALVWKVYAQGPPKPPMPTQVVVDCEPPA